MKHYAELQSQADIDLWLGRVGHFHDGLLKEIHIVNRACVHTDGAMAFEQHFDMRILIQSPWGPSAFELLLVDVLGMHLDHDESAEIGGAEIERRADPNTGIPRFRVSLDESHRFESRRLFIREKGDWLSKRARYGHEIPSPTAPSAKSLGDGWYQCDACTESFEAGTNTEYALCPGCHELTELELG
ncbi:MAG: hypothetical protein RL885_15840 [Planctomycetota bacterium]